MTVAEIKSLFLTGLKGTKHLGYTISPVLAAMVILSGCAGSNPSGVKPVHSSVAAPLPPLPAPLQTRISAMVSKSLLGQPLLAVPSMNTNVVVVPYGSIAAVYTSTNGMMRIQDIGPLPISITNDLSHLPEGQFGISGVTWNPNDANIVVWVHENQWPDWLGGPSGFGNYYHWTLWASPGLETHCWVQMDCKATLSAADVQFNGGPYRTDQCFYRVTRE